MTRIHLAFWLKCYVFQSSDKMHYLQCHAPVAMCSYIIPSRFLTTKNTLNPGTAHAFFLVFYLRYFIYFQLFSMLSKIKMWDINKLIIIWDHFFLYYFLWHFFALRFKRAGERQQNYLPGEETNTPLPFPPSPAAFQALYTVKNILPAPSALAWDHGCRKLVQFLSIQF